MSQISDTLLPLERTVHIPIGFSKRYRSVLERSFAEVLDGFNTYPELMRVLYTFTDLQII